MKIFGKSKIYTATVNFHLHNGETLEMKISCYNEPDARRAMENYCKDGLYYGNKFISSGGIVGAEIIRIDEE